MGGQGEPWAQAKRRTLVKERFEPRAAGGSRSSPRIAFDTSLTEPRFGPRLNDRSGPDRGSNASKDCLSPACRRGARNGSVAQLVLTALTCLRPVCATVASIGSVPIKRGAGDITFIWTIEGCVHLSALIDLCTRTIVGWAVSSRCDTALGLNALEIAVARRRPGRGLIHHTDRGSTYTAADYRDRLEAIGMAVSMGRKGNCWDNAVAESTIGTIKAELFGDVILTTFTKYARSLPVHRRLLQSPAAALVAGLHPSYIPQVRRQLAVLETNVA